MKRKDWNSPRAKVDKEGGCRVCGSLPAEAAHIIPRSLGGGQNGVSVVPLCRMHHTAYDRHTFDLLPHLSYLEQAEAVRLVGIERARKRITGDNDDRITEAVELLELAKDRDENISPENVISVLMGSPSDG